MSDTCGQVLQDTYIQVNVLKEVVDEVIVCPIRIYIHEQYIEVIGFCLSIQQTCGQTLPEIYMKVE